jgi:Mn-dependent DtxR family transcriptional regulator
MNTFEKLAAKYPRHSLAQMQGKGWIKYTKYGKVTVFPKGVAALKKKK